MTHTLHLTTEELDFLKLAYLMVVLKSEGNDEKKLTGLTKEERIILREKIKAAGEK